MEEKDKVDIILLKSENKKKSKNGWGCLGSCFNYRESISADQEQPNRTLASSITIQKDDQGGSFIKDCTINRSYISAQEQIEEKKRQSLGSKQKNSQKEEQKTYQENQEKTSSDSSQYSRNSFQINMEDGINKQQSKISNSEKKANQNQGDKIIACSLDATNFEQFQKFIEQKQKKGQKEIQQLNIQVKEAFKIENKIFIFRDQKNHYFTLASASFHSVTMHKSNFGFQSLTQSIQQNTNNMSTNINSIIGNPSPNQVSLVVPSNSNSIYKTAPSNQNMMSNNGQNLSNMKYQQQLISDPEFLAFRHLYPGGLQMDSEYHDNFTPEKIALHIAETFKKYSVVIDACCGVGGNTIQFSKFNKIVIAVDKNYKALQHCLENVKFYKKEKSLNVEFVCDDFLNIQAGDFDQNKADLVFINPEVIIPSDSSMKVDIFEHCRPNITKAMHKAYSMSKNIAILFPNYIDYQQIPILMQKFNKKMPFNMIEHHCPHIQVLYLNGCVKNYLLLLGEVSKFQDDQILDFISDTIREQSHYQKGVFESKVHDLLKDVSRRSGMQKLIKIFVSSLDQNEFEKKDNKKNLLPKFTDELSNQKILSEKEVKNILAINETIKGKCESCDPQNNNFMSLSPRLNSQNLSPSSNSNVNMFNFDMSVTSQQSNFYLDMQYGSKQSADIEQNTPLPDQKAPTISMDRDQSQRSVFPMIDSSLGDKLEIDEEDFSEEGNSNNDDNLERSDLEHDFYLNENQNDNVPYKTNTL